MLDAPELQDDFYLNLVDWSSQNVLAVGLGSCVYLWSACTSQVSIFYFICFLLFFCYIKTFYDFKVVKKETALHCVVCNANKILFDLFLYFFYR